MWQGSRFATACGAEDEVGNVGACVQSPAVQLPETFGIELRFQSPFDENGVLHHFGTAGGERAYQNPHNTGDVVASMSSFGHSSCSPAHFVQHTHAKPVNNFTSNQPSSWMAVDLVNRRLVPSHYALRSDRNNHHMLRNWQLQASNDGQDWTTLCVHADDPSLSDQPMSVAAWPIDGGTILGRSFRHFRILQTGKNSGGHHNFMCARHRAVRLAAGWEDPPPRVMRISLCELSHHPKRRACGCSGQSAASEHVSRKNMICATTSSGQSLFWFCWPSTCSAPWARSGCACGG